MGRSTRADLPPEVRGLLDGSGLGAKEGETFLLVTAGEEGWPHVAMLSVGEVLAPSAREVRLALWPGTTTTRNLIRDGRATLMVVTPGLVSYVRLACRRGPELSLRRGGVALFVGRVEEVREDRVGYATVTSGIRFSLASRDETVALWEETVRAIAAAPSE